MLASSEFSEFDVRTCHFNLNSTHLFVILHSSCCLQRSHGFVSRYDVWILMSDAFYEYLSDDVRALCRLCDKCTGLLRLMLPIQHTVIRSLHSFSNLQRQLFNLTLVFPVKGSVAPMSFYTYDVNPYPVLPSLPKNGTFWDLFPPSTTVEYASIS
jgi:hypothetical protein